MSSAAIEEGAHDTAPASTTLASTPFLICDSADARPRTRSDGRTLAGLHSALFTHAPRPLPEPAPLPAAPVEIALLTPGARLHGTPYIIVGLLGQGGMGEVYEVEHGELGTRCALKVLHRSHAGRPDVAARMRDEARALARLRHPNLVEVFDLGETMDHRPWFAMPLLRGRDLRRELARAGALPASAAARLVALALDGLAAAHAAGIVHRDVKLENLFLGDDGSLKVLDFGVAKAIAARPDDGRTCPGASPGTPRTMAPEQCSGGPVDARTDVYAAGLSLYELCAGRGPFDDVRGNDHALRFAHCDRLPPAPSSVARQPIAPELEAVILKALAKSPADRFQSAAEMAEALRRALHREEQTELAARPASALDQGPQIVATRPRPRPSRLARKGHARASIRPRSRARGAAMHAAIAALAVAIFALGIAFGRSILEPRADASPPRTSLAAR